MSQPSSLQRIVSGIDHLTLPVGDLAVAERFYVDLLGGTVVGRFDEDAAFRALRPERIEELKNSHNSSLHLSVHFGAAGPRLDLFLQPLGQPELAQGHP